MAKLYFLGTCSGTEPIENMHHCSFVLEVNGVNYWFDAGENCANSSYLSGIKPLKTKAVFISHPHIDHIGGLANLFFLFDKLERITDKRFENNNALEIFFPDSEVFAAVKTVATGGTNGNLMFNINEHGIKEGVIFSDENITVTALHNLHLGEKNEIKGWLSYSFLIETGNIKIVYSGDVKEMNELDTLIGEGADFLIMETGHHKVKDVLNYALNKKVKNLRFNHHGREIINDRSGCEKTVCEFSASNKFSAKICFDNMVEEI